MPLITVLFDPLTGVFNLRFLFAALACNFIGFGMVYLNYATEQKIKGQGWFLHGTLALIATIGGISVLVSLG